MTLTELRYIVALAAEKHFGRAAERCFVAQPTLSVGVRKLEDELGVTLFERGAAEVRTTQAGERVVAQAQKVLEEVENLRAAAETGRDQLVGPLRLGAIYTIGPYLLPHMIPKLKRLAPDMPLVIEENYTARLREKLKRGELDLILISLPFEEQGVVTWPLYEEPFVVVVPIGHRWNRRKGVRAEELAGENLLMLGSGHCFRDQVIAHCPECDPGAGGMQQTVEGTSLETIRHMVASGLGITVLPETSMPDRGRHRQRELLALPFQGRSPGRTVALAWRRSFPRPKAVETVRRAILECHLRNVTYLDFAETDD